MHAVILAAGEGTRLRPFTNNRPKVMIPVGNRPILEYVIRALAANGIKDIVLVVGYKKERIMSFFGDGSRLGVKTTYVVQEKQLGTAHAMTYLRGIIKGRFLVLAGDNIIDKEMVASLLSHEQGNTVLVTESNEPSKYGVVLVQDDMAVGIEEKPTQSIGNIINTGLYSFEPSFMAHFEHGVATGLYGIPQVLQTLVPKLPVHAVRAKGRWDDAVYPWDLIRLNEIALENKGQEMAGTIEPGVTMKGSVSLGKGSRVRSGSYIEGPVTIGEGCDIGPSSIIYPSTSIGDGVTIEPFVSIKNSLIMNHSIIGSHSHLCHSVVDENVRIGSGFSGGSGPAQVKMDDGYHHVPTIGCMIGEDTSIGSGVVISAGTIIGQGCRIGDGAKVTGILENRSIVV